MSTFALPDLGEGLAEAEIREWHVKPGDRVLADQPMVAVETAKAVVEVPVPFDGTVTALLSAVGDIVATGAPLVEFDSGTVVGRMPGASTDDFVDSARVGRGPAAAGHRMRALPVARSVARSLGVDLAGVSGSGRDGIITLEDVLAHPGLAHPGLAHPGLAHPGAPGVQTEGLRGARRAMAHSMMAARGQVASSTVCDDADLHAWTQRGDYMLRLIRALLAGCRAEPALNAWYDAAGMTRILHAHVHLAVAVDTTGGLIVPVLHHIEAMSAETMRAALAAQKDAAHRRSTAPADVRGFTLMLSNFGTLAGRYAIPLVVPPAVAILGAGRVRQDAVVVDDAVVAHRRMPLSLSFDHRCVTGGEACRFLAAVIADLEKTE